LILNDDATGFDTRFFSDFIRTVPAVPAPRNKPGRLPGR
jgi:hypothetical protein